MKKTLNLEIVELEHFDKTQTAVSLMPCPCNDVACGGCHGTWGGSDRATVQIYTGLFAVLAEYFGLFGYAAAQIASNFGGGTGYASVDPGDISADDVSFGLGGFMGMP